MKHGIESAGGMILNTSRSWRLGGSWADVSARQGRCSHREHHGSGLSTAATGQHGRAPRVNRCRDAAAAASAGGARPEPAHPRSRKRRPARVTTRAHRFLAGRATWVGEQGPEIVDLPRVSQVTPNDVATRAAAPSGHR